MDTSKIGDLAESYVVSELLKRDFNVSIPLGENRYDLIAEKAGKFNRIQVKYISKPTKRNTIPIILHSIGRKGRIKYKKDEIDFIVAYFDQNKRFYIVPSKYFKGRMVLNLRIRKAKNNQSKNIVWASNFEEKWNLLNGHD